MKVRRVDFSADEWLVGTAGMPADQVGIYITGCAILYSHGDKLPVLKFKAWIRNSIRVDPRVLENRLTTLLDDGKFLTDGSYIWSKRVAVELERAENRSQKATDNANSRWRKSAENLDTNDAGASDPAMLTINHQPSTINTLNSDELRESARKRATTLPHDFDVPPDWSEAGASAREKAHLPPVDLATEAIKFVNHFTSTATVNSRKKDWRKTWINWCLNARAERQKGMSNGRSSAVENLYEGALRAAEQWERRQGDSGLGGTIDVPLLDGG